MPRSLIAAALLLALAGCASAQERQAAAAAAETCRLQFPNDPLQFNSCVSTLEANIRAARAYHAEPEHPAPRARGGQQRR